MTELETFKLWLAREGVAFTEAADQRQRIVHDPRDVGGTVLTIRDRHTDTDVFFRTDGTFTWIESSERRS